MAAAAMSTNYRPDIDGLRAVAVIPVVLFHSKISLSGVGLFPGGFVGVDIFFVISGYLISNILLNDIRRDQFSILTFYERRIRRIFPALFAVLLVSVLAAAVILLPQELNDFGKSLFWATFFGSNYYFMFDTGYFAATAETKPLLHMWSLAVEEQFYIVFPVCLYLASRFFRDRIGIVTVALLLLSLIYSIFLVDTDPGTAFFSTPARAWELMLGAMLAIFPRKGPMDQRLAQVLGAAGLGFIAYSILFYSEAMRFPGAAALLPCVGAALILYTGQSNVTQVSRLLSTNAFRYPGLISYSLYLWHWPVLVFYRMYAITPLTPVETALLMVAMTAAAWASWKYVEAPFRTRELAAQRGSLFAFGGGVMLAGAAFGAIFALADGLPGRFPDQVAQIEAAKDDRPKLGTGEIIIPAEAGKAGFTTIFIPIGAVNAGKTTFAVWGDSHAEVISPGISAAAEQAGARGVLLCRGGCPPLLGVERLVKGDEGCADAATAAMAYLKAHPEIRQVFLHSVWARYPAGEPFKKTMGESDYIKDPDTQTLSLEENKRVFRRAFEHTLAELASPGRQIVIIGAIPEVQFDVPKTAARALILDRDVELRLRVREYADRQVSVNAVFAENKDRYALTLVRPQDEMCDGDYCEVIESGVPIYLDDDHITRTYSLKLSHLFEPFFPGDGSRKKSLPRDADN